MPFTQPKLEYDVGDLAPHLSERQVSIHYNKHTAKYFDTTNKLIKGTVFEKKDNLEDLINKDTLVKADGVLFNNACQAYNHVFYFDGLTPASKSGQPSTELAAAINQDFESFNVFKQKMTEATVNIFGSGWCWLVVRDNKLIIKTTPNAGNPLTTDRMVPLMCIDAWEHAYLYQETYEANRQAYVDAIWNIINWDKVSQRYADATQ